MYHQLVIKRLRENSSRWEQAMDEIADIDPSCPYAGQEEQDVAFSLMQDVIGQDAVGPGEEASMRDIYDVCEKVIETLREEAGVPTADERDDDEESEDEEDEEL